MRFLLIVLLILVTSSVQAQERLSPLTQDLSKAAETALRLERAASRTSVTSVPLPFMDDFSQDHLLGNEFGYPVLWEELNVSRNNDFGLDAPSIGVAVFDGLDQFGAPYSTASSTANGRADQLTSMDMDLSGSVNVVMSFFFQPAGQGDSPEANDSLILEFFDPSEGLWNLVWSATGTPVVPFAEVYLPVTEEYIENGFQFRFSNYGRLTGALDQWALDWVHLDANRNIDAPSLEDVGFKTPVTTIINGNRTSMPWHHFRNNTPASLMRTSQDVILANNRTAGALVSAPGYDIFESGASFYSYTKNQNPSIEEMTCEAINLEIADNPSFFVYPTANEESATFDVAFRYNTSPDLNADNNLMRLKQTFTDYYSYDDGQADVAYGIQNFNGSGKVALEYEFLETDTLTAVDMQFLFQAPEGTSLEDQLFYLTVWEGGQGAPGDVVYQDLFSRNVQLAPDGSFTRYYLTDTLILEGNTSYFFGWTQPDDVSINIGCDLSQDINTDKLYFSINNTWTASSYPGVIMIRPAFPNVGDIVSGTEELAMADISIWPNPASNHIQIMGEFPVGSFATLYDLEGRVVTYEQLASGSTRMDVSFTSEGLYILELLTESGFRSIEKIVIRR